MPGANTSSTGARYWGVVLNEKGWAVFASKARQDDQNVVTRHFEDKKTKEKKSRQEIHYQMWSGIICDIRKEQNDYGLQLLVDVHDGIELSRFTFPLDGGYSIDFMNRIAALENRITEMVTIRPARTVEVKDGKEITSQFVSVKIGEEKIARKFGKGQAPNWTEVILNGKKVWDKTEQIDFMYSWASHVITTNKAGIEAAIERLKQPLTGKDKGKTTSPIMDSEPLPIKGSEPAQSFQRPPAPSNAPFTPPSAPQAPAQGFQTPPPPPTAAPAQSFQRPPAAPAPAEEEAPFEDDLPF